MSRSFQVGDRVEVLLPMNLPVEGGEVFATAAEIEARANESGGLMSSGLFGPEDGLHLANANPVMIQTMEVYPGMALEIVAMDGAGPVAMASVERLRDPGGKRGLVCVDDLKFL